MKRLHGGATVQTKLDHLGYLSLFLALGFIKLSCLRDIFVVGRLNSRFTLLVSWQVSKLCSLNKITIKLNRLTNLIRRATEYRTRGRRNEK